MNEIQKIKDFLKKVKKIVALTGAGISQESGIPTFRGKGGLWERYDPEKYATLAGVIALLTFQPQNLAKFATELYETIMHAKPSKAHYILAKLEHSGKLLATITQNIDNLHQEAGQKRVIELHGNIFEYRCDKCGKIEKMEKEYFEEKIEFLKKRPTRKNLIAFLFRKCDCKGKMRPNIVMFGESLPRDALRKAYELMEETEAVLLIGTSGIVAPACYLPHHAKSFEKVIIEISPEETALTPICDFSIRGKASQTLSLLFEE